MSPRSREFMDQARERLEAARLALGGHVFAATVSGAYYAMLYAARAALSEEERYAKTHTGTWNIFYETFVESGRFDEDLLLEVRATQKPREGADYDAQQFSREQAAETVQLADRFIAAVTELLGD